ncbi:hypothetical protein ACU5AX_20375 [Sphingomonas sp. XXL09]|uniref:hypothetical protein n=1 Tax=Sphingomonas sp. XXL09 TaxID=3457787 RepID=UPI00406BBFCA
MERTRLEDYTFRLTEFSRPPSKGGNTRAQYRHALKVDRIWYSWFALGGQKWVFVNDEVSFRWKWDSTRQYRNIIPESVLTWDQTGDPVRRGNRGTKVKLRTAPGRLPGRRGD